MLGTFAMLLVGLLVKYNRDPDQVAVECRLATMMSGVSNVGERQR